MISVLLTAFDPYDAWQENASWLCLKEVVRQLPSHLKITTRRYPVDFAEARRLLADDLKKDFDYALHMGQAPGVGRIELEAIGLNVGTLPGYTSGMLPPLESDGPAAYRSTLPLGDWARKLRSGGIPAEVSYHAGTYLCNAALYWSLYLAATQGLKTQSAFLHLPLETVQAVDNLSDMPSLPRSMTAAAVLSILDELAPPQRKKR